MSDVKEILLDTSGLICPEPVMMLHNAVRDAQSGDIIKLLATDPSTERDIPKFCEFLSHALLDKHVQDDLFIYFIQKS